jgi:hypothetical protein
MPYIPWWQRMSPPTFAERFNLGGLAGRVGFEKGGPLRNIVQTDSGKYIIKYTVDGVVTTHPVEPNTLVKAKEIRNKLEAAKGGFYKPTGLEKFTEGPTADARKILDKLSKGSLVDRAAIIDKTGIDSSRLTKVLKEYKDKNFTFPEGTSKKGQVYTKATAAEEAIAQKVYGKTWEKLTVAQRGSIRAGHATGVTGGTPIIPGTSEQNKIAKKVYNKSFNELTTPQKSAIRVGKITEFSKPGPTKLDVINDLKKLVKNKDVLKFIKEGDMSKSKRDTIIKKIAKFLKLPETHAARRIVYLSDAYLGNDFHIKVKNTELAKGAKKIAEYINKQGFAELGYDIRRKTAESEVAKSLGEKSNFLETSREKIKRKLPAHIFTDEVKNVMSSAKAKSGAYSFFVQGIDKNVNLAKAGAVDSLTRTFELDLQSIKKSDPDYHIKREALAKKYNTAVKNFVQKTNADLKHGERPVRAFEVSFKRPSESITRYKEIAKKYPNIIKGVNEVFNKHGYSFKVPKDVKTIYEARNLVESSRAVNLIKKKATAGFKRVFSKLALGEGFITEDILKKQAEGKTVLESIASPFFLDKAVHKGLKRSKADDHQNLAYDRANLLRFVQEGKADISSIASMAMKDPDFKGSPGEYVEWLKVVVADPHQQRLIRERDIETEEALTLPEEKVAKRSERYKSWKSIPAVKVVTEMFKSDEQKTKDLENLLNV